MAIRLMRSDATSHQRASSSNELSSALFGWLHFGRRHSRKRRRRTSRACVLACRATMRPSIPALGAGKPIGEDVSDDRTANYAAKSARCPNPARVEIGRADANCLERPIWRRASRRSHGAAARSPGHRAQKSIVLRCDASRLVRGPEYAAHEPCKLLQAPDRFWQTAR